MTFFMGSAQARWQTLGRDLPRDLAVELRIRGLRDLSPPPPRR